VKEVIKEEPGEEDEEEKNNKLLEQLKMAIKASISKPNKYITNPVRLYLSSISNLDHPIRSLAICSEYSI
jgi:hypothetical protein